MFGKVFFARNYFARAYFGQGISVAPPIPSPVPPASPFARAFAAGAVTVDQIMAEEFEYRPMATWPEVNRRRQPDATRAIMRFKAIFGEPYARVASGEVKTVGVAPERAGHILFASDRPFISVRLAVLPYKPRTGDQVVRIASGVAYQIAEPLTEGLEVARLDLNQLRIK